MAIVPRWARLALLPLGIAFALGAEWTRLQAQWPLTWVLVDVLPGIAFLVAGQYAWAQRPGVRIGPLMVLTGFLWFVGTYGAAPDPVVGRLGYAFQGYYEMLLAWLVLAYPTGRLLGASPRLVVAAGFGLLLIRSIGRLAWFRLSTDYDLADPLEVERYIDDLARRDALDAVIRVLLTVIVVVVLGLVVHRLRTETRAGRRVAGPILLGGIAIAVATVIETMVIVVADSFDERSVAWDIGHGLTSGTAVLVPVAFALGLVRGRLARVAVADLVVGLGGRGEPGTLEDLLAEALGDPTLEVAYPRAGTDGYVDGSGRRVTLPAQRDARRSVTRIEREGQTLAILVHDPAIAAEVEPARSIVAAARLALDNERLAALVRGQLDEVRASRARIVAAEIAERRRVERDLHDGAQQRLVTVALALQLARVEVAGDHPAASILDRAGEDLARALRELRELARGLHPKVLTEEGLGAAVEALIDRSPVPVRTQIAPGRFPSAVEAAAYFVVAEALTNMVRYSGAGAGRVSIEVEAGSLVVQVTDDGVGGADPDRGTGLRGLQDRVAATGGVLTVSSEPGSGTIIRAVIPCG